MKHNIILIALTLLALTTTSCIRHASEVYGDTVTTTPVINNFSTVVVKGGNITVHYTQGKSVTAKITGPESRVSEISLTVDNGTLTVDGQGKGLIGNGRWLSIGSESSNKLGAVDIYITSPTLTDVSMAGSGDFKCDQPITVDALNVLVAGAGDIDFSTIHARKLDVGLAGAGDISIKDVTDADLSIRVSGAGDIDFTATHSNKIELSLSGAGDMEGQLNDCGDVSITMAGAGEAELKGTARTLTKQLSGAADLDTKKLHLKGNR